jgi:hypothetical protein
MNTVEELMPYSDRGVKGRPRIKGTLRDLNAEVQEILAQRGSATRFTTAAGVIESRVRQSYRVEGAP